jgi:uncharacterized protein involved in exopolysaccharide biosynthesis
VTSWQQPATEQDGRLPDQALLALTAVTAPLVPNQISQSLSAGRPVGPPQAPHDDDEVSLVRLVSVVLRYRGLIAGTAVLFAIATVGLGLTKPRTWSARASIIPQVRQVVADGLPGIAAQLGLSLPSGEATQSPAFYVDLLGSRRIIGAVVDSGIAVANGRRTSVAGLYGISAPTRVMQRELAIQALSQNTLPSVAPKTGVIRLQVRAPEASASKELADQMLRELARFNMGTRQSQAAAERRFTEQRLGEARAELREAEGQLKYFLQRNRMFRSPELSFERDRLQREVELRQAIYSALSQSFERARIEEVRDTPVFTVVEAPELPVHPDPRGLTRSGLLALFSGAILGLVLAFIREFARGTFGATAAERGELDLLIKDTRRTAGAPWRLVGRVFGGRRSRSAGESASGLEH